VLNNAGRIALRQWRSGLLQKSYSQFVMTAVDASRSNFRASINKCCQGRKYRLK
jgi:hypothetical protein